MYVFDDLDLDWEIPKYLQSYSYWDNKTGHVAPLQFHSESNKAYSTAGFN